jgi:hypothetical protein
MLVLALQFSRDRAARSPGAARGGAGAGEPAAGTRSTKEGRAAEGRRTPVNTPPRVEVGARTGCELPHNGIETPGASGSGGAVTSPQGKP